MYVLIVFCQIAVLRLGNTGIVNTARVLFSLTIRLQRVIVLVQDSCRCGTLYVELIQHVFFNFIFSTNLWHFDKFLHTSTNFDVPAHFFKLLSDMSTVITGAEHQLHEMKDKCCHDDKCCDKGAQEKKCSPDCKTSDAKKDECCHDAKCCDKNTQEKKCSPDCKCHEGKEEK